MESVAGRKGEHREEEDLLLGEDEEKNERPTPTNIL